MCTSITIVDEASCRLQVIFGDGLTCKVLGDESFSQRTDPMLLQEIFQTPFSSLIIIIKKQTNKKQQQKNKNKNYLPVAYQKHMIRKQVSSRIVKRIIPVDYPYQFKKK